MTGYRGAAPRALLAGLVVLGLCGTLATSRNVQAGPADPVVATQADEIYRYARVAAQSGPLATWTEEEREYHARSMELAVLQAARGPLEEWQIADVKAAVDHSVHSNYARTGPETLRYQRELWAW